MVCVFIYFAAAAQPGLYYLLRPAYGNLCVYLNVNTHGAFLRGDIVRL